MTTTFNGMRVSVEIGKGVYVFFPESGTGKSYLASILNVLCAGGDRVASYTYADFVRGFPVEAVLDNAKYDIVVLDRYDMYYGAGIESIVRFGKNGTVLVACKQNPPFQCEMCSTVYYGNVLEVIKRLRLENPQVYLGDEWPGPGRFWVMYTP